MHWRPLVWIGSVSLQDYENLSNNIADLKRYLSQLKSIVKYYREIDGVGKDVGKNSEWYVSYWFIRVSGAQGAHHFLT